ncbi:hypothetical protein [Lysinibacillus sphaericus]|uniref:hypothetical protein n=1 Tax=Lysinibacillus sphaericus TaxID=1421 RepID=UPI001CC10B13|nr:hypothetical protein [Lysinibacillus sphaericus]
MPAEKREFSGGTARVSGATGTKTDGKAVTTGEIRTSTSEKNLFTSASLSTCKAS